MFKDKLKEVMADQGMSQSELAKICGISRSTVSKWVSGDSEPPEERRKEIASILDLPKDFFEEIVFQKKKIERLSVTDAAELLGMSATTVQKGLIQGVFPWGYAIKTSERKHVYFINAKRFCEIEKVSFKNG